MNTNSIIKKAHLGTHVASITLSVLVSLAALSSSSPGQQSGDKGKERIGIYDSRAVAMAYVGSSFQERKMRDLVAQLKKAKEAGNANEVSRLQAEGQAWQTALHRQGFGTAPVNDILTNIASDLPKIQEAAGITTLVSKWNTTELARHPKAERVDVTMSLVDAFHPNEPQRQRALEIQGKSPAKVKD